MKVLNLCPVPPETFTHNLDDDLGVEVYNPARRTKADVIAALDGVEVVIGDFAGELAIDADVVAAMTDVRHVHQFTVGHDLVDVEALSSAGIPLTNAGDAAAVAMAEYVVMAALALLRSTSWADRQVRAGHWPQHEVVGRSLVELRGRIVGLVGFGRAAVETAMRLGPFGCTVRYTARTRRPEEVERQHGVEWADVDDLFATSDVVALLCDLNPSTHHLLDADRIAAMKPGAFLVNPSRGGLVDTDALAEALASGHLGGAAIDVAEDEPPPADWPLREAETALLSPHTAGATVETRLAMLHRTFDVLATLARGHTPTGILNP